MKYVILAGGTGTRLWPLSRNDRPKQVTKLVTDLTMLEETIDRFSGLAAVEDLYISTNRNFAQMIQNILPQIPVDQYIIEPEKRDTGPAMAYVATWMSRIAPDEPMAFIASDHFIRDPEMYQATFRAAEEMLRKTGKLLDISVQPTFPSTTLGYTKVGKLLKDLGGIHFYEFIGHTEKPGYAEAKKFLAEGSYLWHANYYMWTPQKFVEAYKHYAPTIGDHLDDLLTAIEADDDRVLLEVYRRMEKISIDYAVTEKMNPTDVLIIRGDFGWADLGSWDSVYAELVHKSDQEGNLIKANWHGIDTHDSLIYGTGPKLITTIGVSNLVIVDTPDALLVTEKGRGQEVKKIVEALEAAGKSEFL